MENINNNNNNRENNELSEKILNDHLFKSNPIVMILHEGEENIYNNAPAKRAKKRFQIFNKFIRSISESFYIIIYKFIEVISLISNAVSHIRIYVYLYGLYGSRGSRDFPIVEA
ncbi:hypothetical protein TSAR_000157 [Trichomalopsis sarcophagae]|uniref:Uncharacterized protein n=1 Tax=Trichomalopsis sarcophagae TaxID=543379 RepID=A0A232F2H7_9HYME|nr:hypothetical protein TSAR_000157 [Trichomalopsis sarcophagae]